MQSHLSCRRASSPSAQRPAQPVADLRAVDVVVVDPAFVAGVVRRVDVDALHLPRVTRQQRLERLQVVALHDQIAAVRVAARQLRHRLQQAIGTSRWCFTTADLPIQFSDGISLQVYAGQPSLLFFDLAAAQRLIVRLRRPDDCTHAGHSTTQRCWSGSLFSANVSQSNCSTAGDFTILDIRLLPNIWMESPIRSCSQWPPLTRFCRII